MSTERQAISAPHRRPRFAPGAQQRSTPSWRANSAAMLLVGNGPFVGLLLAATAATVLLGKMEAPLEAELLKRSIAVCRATAGDLQYAATVADPAMANQRLQTLADEPSARVDGAWLVVDRELVGGWRRAEETVAPEGLTGPTPPGRVPGFLTSGDKRRAVVSCPVAALKGAGGVELEAASAKLSADDAGRLWLLVDPSEVAANVRQGFVESLGPVGLAVLAAVAFQLAIALFVIRRMNASARHLQAAESRLVKADKLAALGTLSAGVGHEINNPLTYVLANLAIATDELAREKPLSPAEMKELRETLTQAREGAERVRGIVRELKALSRQDEDSVAALDVRNVVEAAIKLSMNEIKHRARLVFDFGEVPLVDANEAKLVQVFLNLLVNAAHAIPEGRLEANEIRVATRRSTDGRVAVEVSDTGVGISADHAAHLFEPFFTTKPIGEGTGLGLWVCHGIVTSLGGEITVETEPGRGTLFRVLLPASRAQPTARPADAARAAVAAAAPVTRRGKLLVVDDEPLVLKSVERLLKSDFEIVTCQSGAEALARLAAKEPFDAILCDLMMPNMTGLEFLDEVGRSHPGSLERVVFMTGGAGHTFEAQRASKTPQIEKPFSGPALRDALRRIVEGGRHAGAVAPASPET